MSSTIIAEADTLPNMRLPGRLIVKGNLSWLDPKGLPYNLHCKNNAVCMVQDVQDFEYRPTDTVMDGDVSFKGLVYCEELEST